ncbi:MAG: DUF488 domain-containing protein [Deltaproteobacteria bacterium]|nr:DUF488 domain-containing protein [Deltaproteobacteria bacterium]
MNQIFTIGHSTDTIDKFVEYLKHFQIDTIVDVRSVPYSRYANQFNKELLSAFLKKKNIFYIPMGNNLGARYEEKELLFEDGKVDFSKVVTTNRFQKGINRVKAGVQKGHRIALMCSEKNPIECHRFSLVSNYLHKKGYVVNHIIGKDVFTHKLLQDKLLDYYKEYRKIPTDFSKIIKFQCMQGTLFEIDNIDENNLYIKLNKLVGYNPVEAKKEMV